MGRVSGSVVQPMTTQGDLAFGGGGSPVGYTHASLNSLGLVSAKWWNGVLNGFAVANVFDGDDNTSGGEAGFGGSTCRVQFGTAQRIGRYRMYQDSRDGGGARRAPQVKLQSSDDGASWTDRDYTADHLIEDTGLITLPTPITARYWQLLVVTSGGWDWELRAFELWSVQTVGAGNPTRLAPPSERRLLGYDPSGGAPEWAARYPAIANVAGAIPANVAGATPAGGVGTAAGGYDTAANRDILIATVGEIKTQLNAALATVGEIKAQLNAALAALRDRGLLT